MRRRVGKENSVASGFGSRRLRRLAGDADQLDAQAALRSLEALGSSSVPGIVLDDDAVLRGGVLRGGELAAALDDSLDERGGRGYVGRGGQVLLGGLLGHRAILPRRRGSSPAPASPQLRSSSKLWSARPIRPRSSHSTLSAWPTPCDPT